MFSLSIPAFDALRGEPNPFNGFGTWNFASEEEQRSLTQAAEEALHRISLTFGTLDLGTRMLERLDEIVNKMWSEGWDPEEASLNLFVTDFGLTLLSAFMGQADWNVIVRSIKDPSHLSVWSPAHHLELFPFHKSLKVLTNRHGESFSSLGCFLPIP